MDKVRSKARSRAVYGARIVTGARRDSSYFVVALVYERGNSANAVVRFGSALAEHAVAVVGEMALVLLALLEKPEASRR
jgi:hypothetical protein